MTARPAPFPFCRSDAPDRPPRFRDEQGRFWYGGSGPFSCGFTLRESAEEGWVVGSEPWTIEGARQHWQRLADEDEILLFKSLPQDPDEEVDIWWREREAEQMDGARGLAMEAFARG